MRSLCFTAPAASLSMSNSPYADMTSWREIVEERGRNTGGDGVELRAQTRGGRERRGGQRKEALIDFKCSTRLFRRKSMHSHALRKTHDINLDLIFEQWLPSPPSPLSCDLQTHGYPHSPHTPSIPLLLETRHYLQTCPHLEREEMRRL